jgi:hypothetical protein
MTTQAPDYKLPILVTAAFVIAGLLIAAIGGFTEGSIAGGIVAGLGVIPSMWAMFVGMQQKTQTGLALGIFLFLVSIGVAGLLILLRFVDWLR